MKLDKNSHEAVNETDDYNDYYELKVNLDLIKLIDNKEDLWQTLNEINNQVCWFCPYQ